MFQFRMFLYLSCALFCVYSVYSAPVELSVLKTIQMSSTDANYKCTLLRTLKLFDLMPDILSSCPNFNQAKLLTTVKEENIKDGLCILYYNNFENLCYLRNNATEQISVDGAIFASFTKDIQLVCKTLLNNTYFVKNAQPGIDAITSALQSNCHRICTDLDNNVKPICSLSAFLNSIITLESVSKGNVNTNSTVTVSKTDSESNPLSSGHSKANTPLQNIDATNPEILKAENHKNEIASELNQENETENGAIDTVLKDTNSGRKHVPPEVSIEENPSIAEHKDNVKIHNDPRTSKTDQQQSDVVDKTASKPDTPEIRSNIKTSETDKQQENFDISRTSNKPNIPKILDDTKTSEPVGKQNGVRKSKTVSEPDISQITANKILKTNINSNINSINVNDQESVKEPKVKTNNDLVKTSIDNPEEVQVQENNEDRDIKIKIQKDYNIGKEEDVLLNPKEGLPDDDLEIDEGIVPPGEGNQDYGIEVAPKFSEVKSKAEVVKSPEKLKPLQTDEERYTISANYQNQNIDDSGSYFFSYFMMFCIIFVCAYVAYHNKQKILALVVEGRRGRRPSRTRRPNSANYRKLDSNLEEAVTSTCNKNAPQVIY